MGQEVGDGVSKVYRLLAVTCALCASLMLCCSALAADGSKKRYDLNIEATVLGSAMEALIAQTDISLLYPYQLAEMKGLNPVKGRHTLREALDIMFESSGFSVGITKKGTVAVFFVQEKTREGTMKQAKLKKQLLAGAAAFLYGTGAYAQDVELNSGDRDDSVQQVEDRIVVTGSQIVRPASQMAAEVLVIDKDALDATGEVTLGRALRQLPQNNFGASEFGAAIGSNINGAANLAGGSTINLRGLGAESTLILVNGRRIGQSGIFGGASDISGIPLSSVERVEILLDGASSIYGSDAVGGVVNIILKKDYQGLEASYSLGLPGAGGYEEHVASLTGGMSWDTGRITASYEFFKSTDLDGSERPSLAVRRFTSPFSLRTSDGPFGNGPLFYRFNGQNLTLAGLAGVGQMPTSPGVESIYEAQLPSSYAGTSLALSDITVFERPFGNNDAGRSLIPAQDRHTFNGSIEQELNENIRFSADLFYSTRDTTAGAGPFTIQASIPDGGVFNTPPFGSISLQGLVPELPNPYSETTSDSFRWNAGMEAQFGSWKASVYGGQSRDELDSLRYNSPVRFTFDLVAQGLDFLAEDFVGDNDPALVAQLVNDPLATTAINKQSTANLVLDGPVFTLPGGDVHLAVGGEWAEDSISSQSDIIASAQGIGLSVTVPATDVYDETASSSRVSAFGELLVPVISSANAKPFIEQLTLTSSIRYDDYKNYGDSTTWSAGVVWSPNSQIRIRSNRSTSFVVPTLREALVPPTPLDLTFGGLFDFFVDVLNTEGLPTGDQVSLTTFIAGGNPALEPERATTLNASVELTPEFIPGLYVRANWHQTEYKNRISSSPLGDAFVGIPETAFMDFPELLVDDGSGGYSVDQRVTNIASVDVEGFDFTTRYNLSTGFGDISFGGLVAYTTKWQRINLPGDAPIDLVGETSNSAFFAVPKVRYSGNVNWSHRGMAVNLDVSSSTDTKRFSFAEFEDTFTEAGVQVPYLTPLESVNNAPFIMDLGVGYDFGEGDMLGNFDILNGTSVSFRVVNVLNSQPTVEKTVIDTGEVVDLDTLGDYNAALADPRGRVFYISLRKEF